VSPAMREIVANLEHDGACQCQSCKSNRHHGCAADDEAPEPVSAEWCGEDFYDEDDR